MAAPGVDVHVSGMGGGGDDGGIDVKAFGGLNPQADSRPTAPSSGQELAALLGSRLRNEDAFQMTLETMFKKVDYQEKMLGQLQMTVSDLETAHQPWPKLDFESLTDTVQGMTKRLDTLPPDTALVTKKYLKEYDNQWVTKWKAMEEETAERFDRLETRLATFEENVLRVELKIENDVKQCLVELSKCLRRLDEVEETGKESMRIGFERVERDITDLSLKIKEDTDQITKLEEAHAQTADKLVDAIMEADEMKEKFLANEADMKNFKTIVRDRTEEVKINLTLEMERIDKAMEEATELVALNKQHADETQQQLETTQATLTELTTAVETQEVAVQEHKESLVELKVTVEKAVEAIENAPPPAEEEQWSNPPSHRQSPSQKTTPRSAQMSAVSESSLLALPPVDAGASEEKVKEIVTEAIGEALSKQTEEIKAEVDAMLDNMTANIQKVQDSLGANSKAVKEAAAKVKAAVDATDQVRSEVDILMKNILMKEEQDQWRKLMETFNKDLDFFKRKYTRHLGLQVENYTVAGMAKEEDLEKLSTDIENKVGRNELQNFMDKAVERAIHVYTAMQQEADADALTMVGGQKLKSRCMACDRDMSMVTTGAGATMLGPGLLTAGARSLSPSKNPYGKSKGFLPKIAQSTGPSGPGLNPMEMDRLKRMAAGDLGGDGGVSRAKSAGPPRGSHQKHTCQDGTQSMMHEVAA